MIKEEKGKYVTYFVEDSKHKISYFKKQDRES